MFRYRDSELRTRQLLLAERVSKKLRHASIIMSKSKNKKIHWSKRISMMKEAQEIKRDAHTSWKYGKVSAYISGAERDKVHNAKMEIMETERWAIRNLGKTIKKSTLENRGVDTRGYLD